MTVSLGRGRPSQLTLRDPSALGDPIARVNHDGVAVSDQARQEIKDRPFVVRTGGYLEAC